MHIRPRLSSSSVAALVVLMAAGWAVHQPLAGVDCRSLQYAPAIEPRIAAVENTLVPPSARKGDAETRTKQAQGDIRAQHATAAVTAAAAMDVVLSEAYPLGRPGAAAIVMQNGKVLLRRGYGLADLEFRIAIEPDKNFEIVPASPTEFFIRGMLERIRFEKDPAGKVLKMIIDDWGTTSAYVKRDPGPPTTDMSAASRQ